MVFLTERYRVAVRWAIRHRAVTVGRVPDWLYGGGEFILALAARLDHEFLPHLDEGALWSSRHARPQHRSG